MKKRLLSVLLALGLAIVPVACDEGPEEELEDAAEARQEAVEEVREGDFEEAAEAREEAREETLDAMEEMGDTVIP